MHTKEAGMQLYDTFGEDSVGKCSAFTQIYVFSKCVFGKFETLASLSDVSYSSMATPSTR